MCKTFGFAVSLKNILDYINGHHKQHSQVDIISNYMFHFGLQEHVFRKVLKPTSICATRIGKLREKICGLLAKGLQLQEAWCADCQISQAEHTGLDPYLCLSLDDGVCRMTGMLGLPCNQE